MFNPRSEILAAKLEQTPYGPIVLDWVDPETWEIYMNCVSAGGDLKIIEKRASEYQQHFGPNDASATADYAAQGVFAQLLDVYILAMRDLKDRDMANQVIDEIVRFSTVSNKIPGRLSIERAFNANDPGSFKGRVRELIRDFWVYETIAHGKERLLALEFLDDHDFVRDLAVGLLRFVVPIPGFSKSVADNWSRDKCRYHERHDVQHPRCVNKNSSNLTLPGKLSRSVNDRRQCL